MINSISGNVKDIQENHLTVEVNGIGWALQVPQASGVSVGQKIDLLVQMHWNAEQGPALFGFATPLEKTIFLLITGCSGMGPKLAMAVLAQMGAAEFLEAIQSANEKALSTISGIGAKKAEQMIVQLKHKVAKLLESGVAVGQSAQLGQRYDIGQVLKTLNYSKVEIAAVMNHLNDQHPGVLPFDQLMRHALAYLAKRA